MFLLYALRVNISIAIVAMVKSDFEMGAAGAGNVTNGTVSVFNSTTNTTYTVNATTTTIAPEGDDCPKSEGGGTKVVGCSNIIYSTVYNRAQFFKTFCFYLFFFRVSEWYYDALYSVTKDLISSHDIFVECGDRNWAPTWQNQQNECAPSEDSDQPGSSLGAQSFCWFCHVAAQFSTEKNS